MSAYRRSVIFIAKLGDNRVAYLWQQAFTIGFRAGRADTMDMEGPHDPTASEDFALGREAGLKEGRTGGLRDGKHDGRKAGKMQGLKEGEAVGFEKGKAEGLGEGKRLGFVAGRDFGEKRALKMSKTSASSSTLARIHPSPTLPHLHLLPLHPSTPLHRPTRRPPPSHLRPRRVRLSPGQINPTLPIPHPAHRQHPATSPRCVLIRLHSYHSARSSTARIDKNLLDLPALLHFIRHHTDDTPLPPHLSTAPPTRRSCRNHSVSHLLPLSTGIVMPHFAT
ncbi:hypothetical protein B0H14DRAFT_3682882 [Mycena olivaceomarginata]|nr:hypothetical protein B0H14DRAFT_3682882 [Mycena olivaceomarginata]